MGKGKRNRSSNSGDTPDEKKTARRLNSEDFKKSDVELEGGSGMETLQKAIDVLRKQLESKIDG